MNRFRVVLSMGETLYCHKCQEPIVGMQQPEGEECTVHVGDPEDHNYTVLCNPCFESEEG